NTIVLPDFLSTAVGSVVLTVVAGGAAAWTVTRLSLSAVSPQSIAERQLARLELRYERRPPYWLPSIRWYRIGVYNNGPATAIDVKVRLIRITPQDPLPEQLLPSRLGWKGGGVTQHIAVDQELE